MYLRRDWSALILIETTSIILSYVGDLLKSSFQVFFFKFSIISELDLSPAYLTRHKVLAKKGRNEEAEATFKLILDIDEYDGWANVHIGFAVRAQDRVSL